MNGTPVRIPNPTAIIPYIGLFTLVTLDPTTTVRNVMTTPYLPNLSINYNGTFVVAPPNTSATAGNVARIFEPLGIDGDTPFNPGILPISPGAEAFNEKHYWRLPISAAAIFAALMARLPNDLSECEDIILAKKIVAHLTLNRYDGSGPTGGGGPSGGSVGGLCGDGGGGGGGSSGGGRRQSKRKNTSGESSASADKGKRKARNVAGGDKVGDYAECSDTSGEVLRPLWVPLRTSLNVEFPPGIHSQYGQSDCQEITSTLGDDTTGADKDNSDSEAGHSEPS